LLQAGGLVMQDSHGARDMNWADVMTDNSKVSSRDRNANDDGALDSTAWTSWDPHEVWLTRVRQPRELAARLGTNSRPIRSVTVRRT